VGLSKLAVGERSDTEHVAAVGEDLAGRAATMVEFWTTLMMTVPVSAGV
jgi:hypothetical protein